MLVNPEKLGGLQKLKQKEVDKYHNSLKREEPIKGIYNKFAQYQCNRYSFNLT